jgi:hypothetical protein
MSITVAKSSLINTGAAKYLSFEIGNRGNVDLS